MSRSIGDLDLKPYGVTAHPTVIRRSLKHHKVILIEKSEIFLDYRN